jgi:hypothetical protein
MAGILKVDQVQSDSNLSFQVAGANVAYMNSTGLQMTGGQIIAGSNTLLTASGLIYANAGIAFPATQVSSADANTLDDYEEGSWTPVITSGGWTLAVNTATYVKIGKQVTIYYYLSISGSGTGAALTFSGVPFAPSGSANGHYATNQVDFGRTSVNAYSRIDTGTTVLKFLYPSGSTGTDRLDLAGNQIGASYIIGTLTYFV